MRTVNYSEVLQLLSELAGIPYADLPTATALTYRGALSRYFRKAWEVEYWPELTRVDERHYRLEYNGGTTYAAPTASTSTEVFFSSSLAYYQVLRASTGNAPATLSAGTYATNLAFWYPAQASYSGSDHANGVFYAVGTVVRYSLDNRYYACHTAHTSPGGIDLSKWGILTPFDKYVGYTQTGFTAIGDVRDVYTKNPLVNKTYATSNWTLTQNGVQVPNGPNVVWLEYRTRFAPLIGGDWANGTSYAVGDQVLYNSSGSIKNFYTCIQATSSVAPSNTAYWTILEIPYLFQPYMVHGAFADVLRMDGQMDKAAQQERLAEQYLEIEAAKLFNLQPQQQRMDMSAAY